jgi:hypothetical protein
LALIPVAGSVFMVARRAGRRMTPAMEAGVMNRLWMVDDVVALLLEATFGA